MGLYWLIVQGSWCGSALGEDPGLNLAGLGQFWMTPKATGLCILNLLETFHPDFCATITRFVPDHETLVNISMGHG